VLLVANLLERPREGKETTMCFRPSPVKRNSDQPTCQTCGMPVDPDSENVCSFCGDPINSEIPDNFSDIDPSHSTRII